jgi:hypothetical protein
MERMICKTKKSLIMHCLCSNFGNYIQNF